MEKERIDRAEFEALFDKTDGQAELPEVPETEEES
jgi:hypothetical protein